jgi:hypothetical protein
MTLQEFKALMPDIIGYTDAYMQLYIDMATKMVSVDKFGDLATNAIAFLAAHLITVDDNALAVTQSVGGMSISYSSGEDSSHYALTIYGRQYMRMAMIAGVGWTVV